ncbi:DUF7344 domain-containing protein [Halorientalis halophila]|uniref:DUF7344 domain-containing protein n=1 Tax=Halorientalis halophila TaxID=3108499 RepID=UPI0030083EC0
MSYMMHDELRRCEDIERLTDSEYHRLLSADRRRTTLEVLLERTAPIELDALAAAVAARERDGGSASEERLRRVSSTLHHVHLPKMATFGVVNYDSDANRVTSCPSNPF